MGHRAALTVIVSALLLGPASESLAQKPSGSSNGVSSGSPGPSGRHGSIPRRTAAWGAVSSRWWGPPVVTIGPYPAVVIGPPVYSGLSIVPTAGGFASSTPVAWAVPYYPYAAAAPWGNMPGGFGGAAGMVPAGLDPIAEPAAQPNPNPAAEAARRAERLSELVTSGDRFFRAGKMARAEQRYSEAARVDAASALPGLRLAQVAIKQRDYTRAAALLRRAHASDPLWIENLPARDVQNLFGDPVDFAAVLAEMESHVQAHPDDRDAWLVLGTELFLTGRTRRAGDIFVRLTDRPPDSLLKALLAAAGR